MLLGDRTNIVTEIWPDLIIPLLFLFHQSDGLKEELLARQKRAHRALLTSAQLIAPVIGDTLAEGFHWATDAVRASGRGVLAQELGTGAITTCVHELCTSYEAVR